MPGLMRHQILARVVWPRANIATDSWACAGYLLRNACVGYRKGAASYSVVLAHWASYSGITIS